MLGNLFKPKPTSTEEQIKKDREIWLQQMLDKSQNLEQLIKAHNTGWREFDALLTDYINKCKKRKAITALDRASDADIFQLKMLDHEIYILSWVLRIPEQFINEVEAEIKKTNEGDNA